MTKREKIIVLLMAAAILYGGYSFLSPSPTMNKFKRSRPSIKELNKFVTKIAEELPKKELSVQNDYIISRVSTDWSTNPFLKLVTKQVEEEKEEVVEITEEQINLTYSGYIDIGGKKLAIINGIEYETGAVMESNGFLIKSILPASVEIVIPENKEPVFIPLQQNQFIGNETTQEDRDENEKDTLSQRN